MLLEINIVGIIIATSGSTILVLVGVIGFFGKSLVTNFRASLCSVSIEIKKLCISLTKLNERIDFINKTIEHNNVILSDRVNDHDDDIKSHENRITIVETKLKY